MSRVSRIIDPTPEGQRSLSICGNCQTEWETEDLSWIADLEERIEAGGEVPSGTCPSCKALCYLETKPNPTNTEVGKVLEDLLNWAKYMGGFENRVWEQATDLYEKLTGRRIDV